MNTLPPPVVVRLFPHDGKAAGVVRPHVGRLAQPADLSGIEDLDREATADRMRDLSGQIRAFEAERAALAAHWAELPYGLLAKVSNRIINEVRGINRVVYDVSGKPPATIEWE